jgi:hypothetical protein
MKMKKTITVVLVTICYLATSFTAKAQKTKMYKAISGATQAQQPSVANVSIIAAMNPQNPKLVQVTGIIKNETDMAINFSQDDINTPGYRIIANKVENRQNLSTDPNVIELDRFILYGGIDLRNENQSMKYVIEKINDKEFRYTIYNMPINTSYILVLMVNGTDGPPIKENVVIDGALTITYLNTLKNYLFNGATMRITGNAGTTITQNITLSKPQNVN